jgi:hypothetical protein
MAIFTSYKHNLDNLGLVNRLAYLRTYPPYLTLFYYPSYFNYLRYFTYLPTTHGYLIIITYLPIYAYLLYPPTLPTYLPTMYFSITQ